MTPKQLHAAHTLPAVAEEISSSSQQKFTPPHHFANTSEQPTTTPATAVTFDLHNQTSPSSPPPPQQQQQADTISPGVTFSDDQYEQYDSDMEPELDLGVSRETLHEGQVLKAGYLHKKGERIKVNIKQIDKGHRTGLGRKCVQKPQGLT
jgi:hypothetical protein